MRPCNGRVRSCMRALSSILIDAPRQLPAADAGFAGVG
jgi:hypothetical protein